MRRIGCFAAFATLGVLVCSNAFAADTIDLPASTVDSYRIESHYGPDVGVLNPAFPHEGKVEIGVGGVYSPVSSLITSYGFTGSLAYHFSMRHAIEPLWFMQESSKLTGFVTDEIAKKTSASTAGISVEAPKQAFIASYLFSPYYAKMHITERSVTHFDVYFGAGAGIIKTESRTIADQLGATEQKVAGSLAVGMRFLMPPRWSLKLEFRDLIYGQNNFGQSSTGNTINLGLNLGVFFGSF